MIYKYSRYLKLTTGIVDDARITNSEGMISKRHTALFVVVDVYSRGKLDLSILPGHKKAPSDIPW